MNPCESLWKDEHFESQSRETWCTTDAFKWLLVKDERIGIKKAAAAVCFELLLGEQRKTEPIEHQKAEKLDTQRMNSCNSMWKVEHFEEILHKPISWHQGSSCWCFL